MKMMRMRRGEGNRRTKEREEMTKRRDGEAKGKKNTQTWTPNTCALARTTLKITIGCLCRGPSRRFQGACRFSTHKKLARRVRLIGLCFKTGRMRPEKTRARERNNFSRTRKTHQQHQQQQHEQRRQKQQKQRNNSSSDSTKQRKTDDANTRQRRNDHNRDNGRPRRGKGKGREDERDEVKKREGRERGEVMKIMSHREKVPFTSQRTKTPHCKTSFSFFHFSQKNDHFGSN